MSIFCVVPHSIHVFICCVMYLLCCMCKYFKFDSLYLYFCFVVLYLLYMYSQYLDLYISHMASCFGSAALICVD